MSHKKTNESQTIIDFEDYLYDNESDRIVRFDGAHGEFSSEANAPDLSGEYLKRYLEVKRLYDLGMTESQRMSILKISYKKKDKKQDIEKVS